MVRRETRTLRTYFFYATIFLAVGCCPVSAADPNIAELRRILLANPTDEFPVNFRCVVTIPTGYLVSERPQFYCQDASGGLSVLAPEAFPAALGDWVNVQGVANMRKEAEPQVDAHYAEKLADYGEPARLSVSINDAVQGLQAGRLVQVRAKVDTLSAEPERDVLFLSDSVGRKLRVYARRPRARATLFPPNVNPGDWLEVTGLLLPRENGEWSLRFRSESDLEIISGPTWNWTRLSWLAAGLFALIAMAFSWALVLRRSVREKTREIRSLLEEARETSRLKSEFLAMMSHEIRTPLHGVLGMQRLVLDSELAGEQREYLEMGQQAATSLLGLLNDILDFSKIEAGRLDLAVAPFQPDRLTCHLQTLFAARAHEKGLQLDLQLDPSLPVMLEADEARIQQILVNLVGNAYKFTDRGTITVILSAQEDGAGACDLCASVRDSGCGIPAHAQKNIFESFRQADAFTSRRHGGTGLGLSISAKLAHLMGGELWLHLSTPEGSEFRFRIPCTVPATQPALQIPARALQQPAAPEPVPVPAPLAPIHPGSLRLLVAEDNTVNQHLIRRLLERAGHIPIVADNGRIAVDILATQPFDAILMDVQMPEMDGVEATAAIRALEAESGLRRIPIIGLTAHSLKGDRDRFLSAGMDECLAKPLKFELLLEALERFCPAFAAKE